MRRLAPLARALAAALALAPLALPAPASAQVGVGACEEPNVLIVLDRSGSMLEFNKWQQAVDAITQMTQIFEPRIRFGLLAFPWNGECRVVVNEALRNPCVSENANAIRQELLDRRTAPERGNNTPIGDGIFQATAYFRMLQDQTRRSFIVMITDGMETCRGNPIVAAQQSFQNDGIPVFVIGFGNGVDANVLNQMAIAGGTDRAYQVGDGQQLFEALADIADQASEEVCDGSDNDCDGVLDEGVNEQPCESGCGQGRQVCVDGAWSECFGGEIPMETCNGLDDDCDAITDEQATIPCMTLSGQPGTRDCVDGGPSEDCTPDDPNREEVCDAIDNDGDGRVDEGTDQPCSVDCHEGRRLCVDGAYLRCSAEPATQDGSERCDGDDDDCDGTVDEDAVCPGEEICGAETGACLTPCPFNECADGFVCSMGYCVPLPCNPPCGEGQRCVRETCYDTCLIDRDCGPDGQCVQGLCQARDDDLPTGGTGGDGVAGAGGGGDGGDGFGGAGGGGPISPPPSFDMGVEAVEEDAGGCHCDVGGHEPPPSLFALGLLLLGLKPRRTRR